MSELHFALYASKARDAQSRDDHNEILRVSQRNNKRDEITGFLHREAGFFLQYLEGPKTKLIECLAKIERDTRHKQFEILKQGPLETRIVPDWQMGFVAANQLQLGDLIDTSKGTLQIQNIDFFDLVIFLVNNAELLREEKFEA